MEGARYLEDGKLTSFFGVQASTTLTSEFNYNTFGGRSRPPTSSPLSILAGRLLFQLEQRADQGLPPKSKLFAAVIDDYKLAEAIRYALSR